MYPIGLSTKEKSPSEELFCNYKKAGIKAMEIAVSLEEWKTLNFKEIGNWSQKYGIQLWSGHLPYYSAYGKVDVASTDKQQRDNLLDCYEKLIQNGSEIGVRKFVVHPSNEPIEDDIRREKMACAKDSLSRLAEIAAKYQAVIAVENLPRTCLGRNSDEMLDLISAHPALRVCFDTNHLLQESSDDFLHKLGSKIITMHVSDYDFINERHWLPGEGDVDWNRLLDRLQEINYQGVWMYELGFFCPGTILRDRELCCEDFTRNAKELFARKKPTVIATRKKDLGMW